MEPAPFAHFAPPIRPADMARAAITAATRRAEAECLAPLVAAATLPAASRAAIRATAERLVTALRASDRRGAVEALVQEYALSSQEGVALMCLAEALLRIPDRATRDALIRDKIADGDWRAHLGNGNSLFVNAATWGLVITGRLVGSVDDRGLSGALTRLIARAGEPVIRSGVDLAMRMMGEQFVAGQTIEAALRAGQAREARGYRHSYDMLGEAAATAQDADRYYRDYEAAIHAIGQATRGEDVYRRAGISIKLSALHPRYARAQADRVMTELYPRVEALAALARHYDIGFNIDAEEQDRLELSLDILQSLAGSDALRDWAGLGFVVQAYGKRCPQVIEWIIALARANRRRIMVRLVKGAYWDAEIKRAQVDGLADFPVYTRKHHTDIAYVACARALLAAPDAVFPQFATHNAQTLATIHHLAGDRFDPTAYEFQCLHGMGEALYDHVVPADGLARPCRIYAPVGTHETLLAYLVRRLLENGANSSFVNRIGDPAVAIADLVVDPVNRMGADPEPGAPHPAIALPPRLHPDRANSAGIDLTDETALARLGEALRTGGARRFQTPPTDGAMRTVLNPADHRDQVGTVHEASPAMIATALTAAQGSQWPQTPVATRATTLDRAAAALQEAAPDLIGLLVREAGKSVPNAIGEVREAVDFLRYYAQAARSTLHDGTAPLGPVACISPWNFPLAIFTGQIAAALAAGNPVLAKPAEETPLIAALAVDVLHRAGVPADALHLLPGDGAVGAALVGAPAVAGVLFTGSTEVARHIAHTLAKRTQDRPIPLIAETGGLNAMVVDSSALTEQVVADVIASAFDSAGQRCSALRVLCLQEDIADRTLAMLRGAMNELRIGRTDRLATDIGPVITADARDAIEAHVAAMAARGCAINRLPLPADCAQGTFVAPTIITMPGLTLPEREVFGPVLHVVRYARADLDRVIAAINATGYGLTFGLHTRIGDTVAHVTARVAVGNLYVNRSIIGATVGVQPFGGRGLSGTGPKAGGPLYLTRLVQQAPILPLPVAPVDPALTALIDWLDARGDQAAAAIARAYATRSHLGAAIDLPGPVGETNRYTLHPRGRLLLVPRSETGLFDQIAAMLATGNHGTVEGMALPPDLPAPVAARLATTDGPFVAALVEGHAGPLALRLAAGEGAIVPIHAAAPGMLPLDLLLEEIVVSTNTTAAGGNASLMALA